MVEVQSLSKIYGSRYALRGISFVARPGRILGVFGPNGAGKSTLVRIVAGQARPSSGRVLICGHDPAKAPLEARRRVGVVGHHTFLYEDLTAYENLRFYSRMFGLHADRSFLVRSLQSVGLQARAHEPVRHFSRGMQQRLALARATLHEPDVLLLDEPYTGLDREAALYLDALLKEQRAAGRTVLLITHDVEHGLRLADDVVVLVRGRIAAAGGASDFTPEAIQRLYDGGKGGQA